jgi:hypothetical protein
MLKSSESSTRHGVLATSVVTLVAISAITFSLLPAHRALGVDNHAKGDKAEQIKYSLKVPGGLAFNEFRGYEDWQVVAVSQNGGKFAVILGNPEMIAAYKAGIPQNGKPFPNGAKLAKIHWTPKTSETFPSATVPGAQHDVDFMVKDSKKFAESGGWGFAEFEYDAASDKFRPGTTEDKPPQANDAKCGAACHTIVKTRDYVFTEYASR